MGACPACVAMPLSEYEASPGLFVEICTQCRGMYLDRHEVRDLLGGGSLAKATEVLPVSLGDEIGMRCPKCVDPAMQPLAVKGAEDAESWQCRSCGGLWLEEGAFFSLKRAIQVSKAPPVLAAPVAVSRRSPSIDGAGLTHSRSRYDEGFENLIAIPAVLLVSALICSTMLGRLFASLVGMPFHELGHAAASWLSSRIAIPLPFFTFWFDDQSVLMGAIVAGVLGYLIFHTYREKNWFMLSSLSVVLLTWAVFTFLVPARQTLMWQILAGAWGELIFGGFLLMAFHFPFPDRFRWDFWRWLVMIPAALCFTYAVRLWRVASNDVSQMPWGSAIGAQSDGDMNRLVKNFGWTAEELTGFYLTTAYLCIAALIAVYAYAAYRLLRKRGLSPRR